MPANPTLRCGACSRALPPESWDPARKCVCPACGAVTRANVFPAMTRAQTGAVPEPIAQDTEASCFYHPRNRAVFPCEECGRFLCNLCELRADGRRICPACFGAALRAGKLVEFETRRTNYDTVALAMTTPAILILPAIFTAPAALFMVIRHWKTPRGILPRTRVRYYLAALLALAEIGGLGAIVLGLVRQLPFFRS